MDCMVGCGSLATLAKSQLRKAMLEIMVAVKAAMRKATVPTIGELSTLTKMKQGTKA